MFRASLNLIGVREFTFEAAADTSDAIRMEGRQLVGLQMPAAWTAAGLAFEVSYDGVTWATLKWNDALLELTADVSEGITLEPSAFVPWEYVRLVSGTHAAPVAQVAARTVIALTRAV